MTPLELANIYMDAVYKTGDFDNLKEVLADDFIFRGPLYKFDTANDYIEAMQTAPPKGFEYSLLNSYENNSSACLIYEFSKPGVSTIMTQTFEIDNGKIKSILLIFDTAAFEQKY